MFHFKKTNKMLSIQKVTILIATSTVLSAISVQSNTPNLNSKESLTDTISSETVLFSTIVPQGRDESYTVVAYKSNTSPVEILDPYKVLNLAQIQTPAQKRFIFEDITGGLVPPLSSWFPFWGPHGYFNLCPQVTPDDPVWSYGCAAQPFTEANAQLLLPQLGIYPSTGVSPITPNPAGIPPYPYTYPTANYNWNSYNMPNVPFGTSPTATPFSQVGSGFMGNYNLGNSRVALGRGNAGVNGRYFNGMYF